MWGNFVENMTTIIIYMIFQRLVVFKAVLLKAISKAFLYFPVHVLVVGTPVSYAEELPNNM